MLFQHKDPAAGLGEGDGGGQPAGAAADDDGVQVGGDLLDGEVLLDDLVALALIQDVGPPPLPGVLAKRVDGRGLEAPPAMMDCPQTQCCRWAHYSARATPH